MNQRSFISPQLAFWGLCLISLVWLAATTLFEVHLGWPITGVQWAKRLVGWAVELWLLRTFLLGYSRCRAAALK